MSGAHIVAIIPCRKLTLRNVRWQMRDVSWEFWLEDLKVGTLTREFLVRLGGITAIDKRVQIQLWPIGVAADISEPIYQQSLIVNGPDDAGGCEVRFQLTECPVTSGSWYDAVVLLDGRWLGNCLIKVHER